MPFSEGQLIVHPFHGIVRVKQIINRSIDGTPVRYLDLTAIRQSLEISVPMNRATELGLRHIIPPERVFELLHILSEPSEPQRMQWSRRMKDYQARLATGELEERCIVIREITRLGERPPASAEGMMLRSTRSVVALEFSIALDITQPEAEVVIDTAVRGETIDLGRVKTAAVA